MSREATHTSQQAADAVLGELMRNLLSTSRRATGALLSSLQEGVRAYEVEFRGYLNGQGLRPPVELGAVLATAFQELGGAPDRRLTLDFRLEALEARFHAARRLLMQRLERDERRSPVRLARTA